MWRGNKLVFKRFCISFTDALSLGVILRLAWALTYVVFLALLFFLFFFFSFCAYILLHDISHLGVILIHILELINHKCFRY